MKIYGWNFHNISLSVVFNFEAITAFLREAVFI